MTSTPDEKSIPNSFQDDKSEAKTKNEFPWLFFLLCLPLTMLCSYLLAIIFRTEDQSLSYLPRFLPSIAIAAIILHLLGITASKPKSEL